VNSSIYSADRTTHLRIVALVMAVSVGIMAFAISVRASAINNANAQASYSVRAGKALVPGPATIATREVTGRV
jgi:hypothetical protein